jgi:5-methylcytosine-specific restriction endonuclease McrA
VKKTPLKRRVGLKGHPDRALGVKPRKSQFQASGRVLKAKPSKRKKTNLKKLKEKLWKLCREIQIRRHGRTCYCCGATDLQGSNCHLGHFIPSSVCSTEMRYDLDNLRPSCYRCNINLSGNWIAYEKHLMADGIDIVGLKQRNEHTKGLQYREDWYESKVAEYTKILAVLQ